MTSRTNLVWSVAATTAAVATVAWIYQKQQKQKQQAPPDDNTTQSTAKSTSRSTVDTEDRPPIAQVDCNNNDNQPNESSFSRVLKRNTLTIVHGSVTGTCEKMAQDLYRHCQTEFPTRTVQLARIPELDWWDELLNSEDDEDDDKDPKRTNSTQPVAVLLILLPTYTNGTWTPPSLTLQDALHELETDWRIAQNPLKQTLQIAVYGVGSSAYDDETTSSNPTFGRPARQAVRQFQKLGSKCLARLAVGDAATGNHAWETYEQWKHTVVRQLHKKEHPNKQTPKQSARPRRATPATRSIPEEQEQQASNNKDCGCAPSSAESSPQKTASCCQSHDPADSHHNHDSVGCCQSSKEEDRPSTPPTASEAEYNDSDDHSFDSDDDDDEDNYKEPDVMDVEDMGDALLASRTASQQSNSSNNEPREMVTPSQAAALKKEGYKLIGTHSAVKLCRWTKHQLRGRGGCYKHTFYGITSYQCMEATPSLACANKCVFCWRHHKNPVAKEWKWKTDDPNMIVEQAVQKHVQMIKETRGIPGVRMDRWKEAHTVRHCALSLVGEPIMYPRIDELLADLHRRHISSFLVTNGQHPEAIERLRPITQLYVSVDAPTKESLIEIDRPLFFNAWERLQESLQHLKAKGQRTVARLTVVKAFNTDELEGYAKLIALGHVSLVEIKGVTFCGTSAASNLNMTNSPYHHEVVELTKQLKQELDKLRCDEEYSTIPEYDLACEHKHSCSVLLARVDQFSKPGKDGTKRWHTWIDYDKFHELAARHVEDPSFTFSVEDYAAETPSWALFGANEEGFDPTETRHRRKNKHPKYTQFDDQGIPTHDHNNQVLPEDERAILKKQMQERIEALGADTGTVVTEFRDGSKEVQDPSLMFRGMTIVKE